MREIHIDLSSDYYLQQPKVFGGYVGEHNESKLVVKLPNRMIRDDISYYYFEFQTALGEHITSPNIYKNTLSSDNEISIVLWEQLLPSAGNLKFCVNAIELGENDTVTIKGKTSIFTLHISESPTGEDVLIDPKSSKEELQKSIDSALKEAKDSGEFKGTDGYTPQKGIDYFTDEDIASLNIPSVDQSYNPDSENAQSGKAVAEAVTTEQNRANNTFSNTLKGSKSGSVILIDDVSPIERNMIVRVSSDTLTDLSTVKIYKYGKNLFDLNKAKNATLTTYMNKPCLSYVDGANSFEYTSNFKEDTQYTFTTKFYREEGDINKPINFSLRYTDGTSQTRIIDSGKIVSVTSQQGKTLDKITGNNNYGLKCYIDLSVTQIELGTTASEYEPYKECVEYTPNADGTVNGVTSLYPSTTLTTDTNGVLIDCECNRDINKAFAKLQQAIISLGGNV